jgi:predicted permease
MSLWRAIRAGTRSLIRRQQVEQDLDDELQHFLELITEENLRAGMPRAAAERAARLQVGGIEATRSRVRATGWEAVLETSWHDLRYALRGLLRNPGFSALAVLTIALGIGANTAMFSVINAVILRPLPYRDAERLALIWTDDVRRGLHNEATPYITITDWRAQSRAFSGIAYFTRQRVVPLTNERNGEWNSTRSSLVSGNLFDVLGVAALRGRAISAQDEAQHAPVAVISYAYWQRQFGGAADILGRSLVLDGLTKSGHTTLAVIGVMPPEFYFPDKLTEIWTPATTYWRFTRESTERFHDWARSYTAVGRLATGVAIADARADLSRIGNRLRAEYPTSVEDFPGFATTVSSALDSVAGSSLQATLWLLLGAVGVVLLVACLNVANLLLARGAARQQEFAVRRALGAGRARLIRQLTAESIFLALCGGVLGVAIASWGTRIAARVASAYVPRLDEITLDARVLLFATTLSIVSGLVFGIVPALRLSGIHANEALRESGRGTSSVRLRQTRGLLVMAECSLAVVLLAGAGLLIKSLYRLNSVDPGFKTAGVLAVRLEFPAEAPPSAEELTQTSRIAPARARGREQRMRELLERLRTVPGVESVGFIDDLFIAGQGNESITIPGRSAREMAGGELLQSLATPEFFQALRVPLVRGRYLTHADAQQRIRASWSQVNTDMSLAEKERLATPEPVVVNAAFVKRYFPDENPIGKRFCIDPTNKTYWYEIVGVIGDMHRQGLERSTIPQYIGPYYPSALGRADLIVRTSGDPLQMAAPIRSVVKQQMPAVTIASTASAESMLDNFSAVRRLQTGLLAAFAALALILAAVGIFGLVHYAVGERTREIGVRVALGASPGNVLKLVIRQGMHMPAIGIVLGLAAAAAMTRIMTNLLFEVGALDPLTFATVAGALSLIALLACYVAARRALALDPLQALR